ncbi:helix-turn-helix domain-containing protein [Paucibacter sp. DJ1R-11]|uniref:helix-turn-helix domain-containing protein n=1 Tax=Paucibacter sp. DJ1R-11 TaxID=2893556 RepID=UPI0021E40FEA|nr:helix-turn-helix domain-containing protein [Paucibacter sp. DJ1R-11]MCV2362565.1 helix-turn-helix domain-containing protein [Paucibacter sp. DJ1R-11]
MPDLPPILPLLDAALRGALLAMLLLLGWALWRDGSARPRPAGAQLGMMLAAGLMVQVISSMPAFEGGLPLAWQAPAIAISVANAPLFALFARALFVDEFQLRPRHALIWLAAVGLSLLNCIWLVPLSQGSQPWRLAQAAVGLQRSLPLLCGLVVAGAALQHWRVDLVERRRRLRLFVVLGGSAYMCVMVWARASSPHNQLSPGLALADMSGLLLILTVLALGLLRLPAQGLFGGLTVASCSQPLTPDPKPDPIPDTDPADLQRLLQLVHQHAFHRSEEPSLGALAALADLPEYRLRRLIHQGLGHRNFNAFINSFRLAEARAALADPARRGVPILSLALEAGFQSIGPFNRAFKAETGLTPSEYRQQGLGAGSTGGAISLAEN